VPQRCRHSIDLRRSVPFCGNRVSPEAMSDLATPAAKPADEDELYGDLVTAAGAEGEALLRAEVDHLRTQTAAQAVQLEEMSAQLQQLTQEVSH
jgi:hypothetical protein